MRDGVASKVRRRERSLRPGARSGRATKLAAVAFPTLSAPDRRWIETLRSRHDPQARLIRAHFTLVFPKALAEERLVQHVARVCRQSQPIQFTLRRAQAVRSGARAGGHVFLVPGRGRARLVALHASLHEGDGPRWPAHLRFEPHITVAACDDLDMCRALARELGARRPSVSGTIERLEVLRVFPSRVEVLATLPLGRDDQRGSAARQEPRSSRRR